MRITFFALSFTLLLSAGITMNVAAASPCPYKVELCGEEPDSLKADHKHQKVCKQSAGQELMRSPQAKAELKAGTSPQESKVAAVQQNKKEPAHQQSFSAFSFLYYLFYKFSPQDIVVTPSYSSESEISTPSVW